VRSPQWVPSRPDLPGLGLSIVVGAVAFGLTRLLPRSPVISDILLALVLGALVVNTPLGRLVGLATPGADREPDRYAAGLRFAGKWVLRLGIIAMGLKVQTHFFGASEILVIGGIAAAALPSTFFIAHALGAACGVRRALVDLLAGGTMICGASAVNAIAPVAKAHRHEQGVAIAVVFLFSVVALIVFRPIAAAIGLSTAYAGLWGGLAVNDLSSAIAVGSQMGGTGEVMAATAKSARILLLAPLLVILSLMRREGGPITSVRKSIIDALPAFLFGYIGLAIVRFVGDRVAGDVAAWHGVLAADAVLVDVAMVTVAAGIGLNLGLRSLIKTSPRALVVGGGASIWMAALVLGMLVAASRGSVALAVLIGTGALAVSAIAYRLGTRAEVQHRVLVQRFEDGAPLSLAEATRLLDERDATGFDDAFLRRVLVQLHPTIGELIPIRDSPLPHGEGCRWVTYWQGSSGWALVALSRDPGSTTPIHAHPHRLLGKAIEGVLEELRFVEHDGGEIELTSRAVLGHEELVETNALSTIHVVRAVGPKAAIDLQLRGPEVGQAGRVMKTDDPLDVSKLVVGTRLRVREEADRRPGHGGEGASAGRVSSAGS